MDTGAQMLLLQVQRQHASTLIDAASKLAFHSKRAHLVLADLPPAHGHGGAALPHLLAAPEAADVLFRPERVLSTAEVGGGVGNAAGSVGIGARRHPTFTVTAVSRAASVHAGGRVLGFLLAQGHAPACSPPLQAEPLPKPPLEVGVTPHWLAVDGVQPATAENAQPRAVPRVGAGFKVAAAPAPTAAAAASPAAATAGQQSNDASSGGGGSIAAGLPLRHSLPDELQLYYDMVRRMLQSKQGTPLDARAVTASLATDPGT